MRSTIEPRWTPEDYRKRPTEYDPSLADQIIERLSNGELLPVICSNRDMPLPGTFLRWCDLDPILDAEYIKARRRGTELSVDEMVIEAFAKDPGVAGIRSRAIKDYVQMTDPTRYGPRATVKVKEGEEEDGGIDYRAEVRRKVEALAARVIKDSESSESQDPQSGN